MNHAPSRRWFRWSLRTLFVVVTMAALLALAFPTLVNNYTVWQKRRRQAEIVRQLDEVNRQLGLQFNDTQIDPRDHRP